MVHDRTPLLLGSLTILALLLSGCAAFTPQVQERYFWPPPPIPARIEWLTAYHSQLDLGKTPLRRIKEAVVGEDTPIELVKPVEVRADAAQDKFYVADIGAAAIFVFDLRQYELRQLSMQGSNLPAAIKPIGLALDRENNLYALEPRLNQILVFDPIEKFVRSIQLEQLCKRPLALAIDRHRNRLYVSDAQLNKVFALDLNGTLLFTIGGQGDSKGEFNLPIGVTVNSKGEIIVAEAFNARVQVFDAQGAFLRAFGKRGDGPGDFQLIKSVAVDSDDNIYVADGKSNNVKIFNQTGELLLTFGGYYAVSSTGKKAPGGFAVPIGIDIDSRDRLFVVDQLNSRVQVFQYLSNKGGSPGLQAPQQAK